MLWSPKRRGDLQEVPKIVILLGNSLYFRKLVAEERLATSDNKKAFILAPNTFSSPVLLIQKLSLTSEHVTKRYEGSGDDTADLL